MGISFDRPLLLLIFLPLLALTLIPYLRLSRLNRKRPKHLISLGLRLLAIILVSLLASGFMTVKQTKKTSIIILADLSDSTKNIRQEMNDYIKRANKYADKNTKIGLMTFGYDSIYELPLTNELKFTKFETAPKAHHTDIGKALQRASSIMPTDTNRRIIVLSDGKETIGEALIYAKEIAAKGIRVDAILLESKIQGKEIQINDIKVADTLYVGESFELVIEIESNYKTQAKIRIFSENTLTNEVSVSLQEGTNRFIFQDKASVSGIKNYKVEVEAVEDGISKNNTMYSYIKVLGKPNILVVDGSGDEAHEFVKIVEDNAICHVVRPLGVPKSLEELRKYDGIILMNVQKRSLPVNWDDMLEQYVRQLGRGLLTVGGDKSYALGGWADTSLEKILPVNVYQRDEMELSSIAISLLIDNSGSMGQGKGSYLEIAKEGAISVVESLKSIDEVGVIAFSDNAVTIAEMTSAMQKNTIIGKISRIPPGGGTMMSAAMRQGYKDLKDSDKALKHMIILSDGYPADSGFQELAKEMAKDNITITGIALGQDANAKLLEEIANLTGGRSYKVLNEKELPNVMLEETFIAMGEYLNNETFTPVKVKDSQVLKGITGFVPLHGYIGTEIKEGASLVLSTDEGRPVYAEWQYGLGFVASFTSDLNGKWSSSLLKWDKGQGFVSNILSRILPSEEDPDLGKLELSHKGDKGYIKATLNNYDLIDYNLETKALIVSPEGKDFEVPLHLAGVGVYEGDFVLGEEGNYLVSFVQTQDGDLVFSKESVLVSPYSDEYDAFLETSNLLATIVSYGEGGIFDNIEEILNIKIIGAKTARSYVLLLMIITIFILLLDVAIRRIQWSHLALNKTREESVSKKIEVTEKKKIKGEGKAPIESTSSLNDLLKAKEEGKRKKL